MRSRIAIVWALVFLFLASTGCVTRLREASWIVVKTKRFEIYSTLRPEEAKALGTELERFHALVYLVTNAPRVESAVPTEIFALARRSQYSQVGASGTAGLFMPGLRSNQIVLADISPSVGASQVILHEYVHFILRNGKNRPYPVWYDEGLADFFSTVVPHGKLLVVGAIPKRHIPAFERGSWATIEQIISARDYGDLPSSKAYMLYPQSWALVHYLALDRDPGSPPVNSALLRFLDLMEGGNSADDAYRAAFGEVPGVSGRRIRSLLDEGRMKVIGVPIAKLEFDRSEPTVRTAGVAEMAIRLGQLHLKNKRAEAAEKEFLAALSLRQDDPRAHAGLGDALKFQSRFDDAKEHFERAVALDPKDPLNHLDLAEYHHDRELKQAGSVEALRADLETARGHYRRALELDPDLPETLVMLGATYLAPGEEVRRAEPFLEKGFTLVPSSPEVLALLAEHQLASGDEVSARQFLNRMLSVRGEGRQHDAVDQALDEMRKRRQDAAAKVRLPMDGSSAPGLRSSSP